MQPYYLSPAFPGHLRPDGVQALGDDRGEPGQPFGIKLQPLVFVFVPGTPAAVVEIPIVDAGLGRERASQRKKMRDISAKTLSGQRTILNQEMC